MKTKKTNNTSDFLINPSYYFKVLKYKSIVILLVTGLFALAGVFLAQTIIKPKYKATAKLIRYDKKISMPRDVPYKFQNFNYDTALQTIRTRENLQQVIQKLKLQSSVEKLYSAFEIKRGRNSDIIEIRYTNNNIKKAVLGANVLSEIFLKNFYKVQNAATKEIYKYYENQKIDIHNKINTSLIKKDAFIKKHKILSLKIQKEYKYKQLHETQLSLIDAKVSQKEFHTKVKEINKSLKNIPKEVQLKYSVRSADRKNLENKKKELRKLKQRYTLFNPKVKKIMDEITIMEKDLFGKKNKKAIPDETTYGNNPIVTALKIEESKSQVGIVASKTKIKQLELQRNIIQKEIKGLNTLEKKFKIIQNEINQNQNLMNKIVDRLSEVKMALESSLEDFKFLEYATAPKYKEPSYKKAMVVLLGFLGFTLCIATILLIEFFNHKIKERFDLQKRFGIDVLGTLLDKNSNTDLAQRYEMDFFDNFFNCCKKYDNTKIILFGSDVSQTGKTFVIENLIHLLSHQNKKTLFIQSVEKNEKETQKAQLNASLFENKKIDYSLFNKINEHTHKAYILSNSKNKYAFTDLQSMQKFFEELKHSSYDYIFIEMSHKVSNPYFFAAIASFCSFTCLVCKYRHSHRKMLKELVSIMQKKGIQNIKGVLNVIHKKYI